MAIDQWQKERPESPMDKRKAMHLCYGYVGHEGARQPLNCDVENLFFISFKLTDMLLFSSSNENKNSFCILCASFFNSKSALLLHEDWYYVMAGLTHSCLLQYSSCQCSAV